MAVEKTVDPNVDITKRSVRLPPQAQVPFVEYLSNRGEKWRIDGECNKCGLCFVGAVGAQIKWVGAPGQPNAFIDLRPVSEQLDNPVRPGIRDDFPSCTLGGEYL